MGPRLAALKMFMIFRNTVLIYNTRNQSNDTREGQRERNTCFNAHFQHSQSEITGLNKIKFLKCLDMLKCESRTSLNAVQYK